MSLFSIFGQKNRNSRRRSRQNTYVPAGLESLEKRELRTSFAMADVFDAGDQSNDTYRSAAHLGTGRKIEQNLTITPGDLDYFRWTAARDGQFIAGIEFEDWSGNLDLAVWNQQGRYVGGAFSQTDNEKVVLSANAGDTFTMVVFGRGGIIDGTYDLRISGSAAEIKKDRLEFSETTSNLPWDQRGLPEWTQVGIFGTGDHVYWGRHNDSVENATSLPSQLTTVNENTRTVENLTLHHGGDHDFYEYTPHATGGLDVVLNHDTNISDLVVEIYDREGVVLDSTADLASYRTDVASTAVLNGETLYIHVYSSNTRPSSDYDLRFTMTPSLVESETVTRRIVSTFDTDTEGWGTTATPFMYSGKHDLHYWNHIQHDASGHLTSSRGYYGQGILENGYFDGTQDWFWSAPENLLDTPGDVYRGRLAFDMSFTNSPTNSWGDDVVIIGGGLTLKYDIPAEQFRREWTTYEVPLEATTGWIVAGTPRLPTAEEMQSVLQSLDRLLIKGSQDRWNAPRGLDNVVLEYDVEVVVGRHNMTASSDLDHGAGGFTTTSGVYVSGFGAQRLGLQRFTNRSAGASELAATVDSRLGLRHYVSRYDNLLGRNEKWFYGQKTDHAGGRASERGRWYFMTEDGNLYEWGGSVQRSRLIADLGSFGALAYQDPSRLCEASNRV